MASFDLGFLIFPDVTQLDFTGPYEVLSRLGTPPALGQPPRFAEARTHVVAATMEPVRSDRGLGLMPTCTYESCPPLDLICVPGGGGVIDVIRDPTAIAFVRRQAARAEYVTSVCTGALVLGAAGLLKGRRATTHWAYTDLLPLVGALHERARVVRDGNLFTAGGVTSGIDFGLAIVAELAGSDVAEAVQLAIEYDPAPPFDAGHPDRAGEAATALMTARNAQTHSAIRQAIAALAVN